MKKLAGIFLLTTTLFLGKSNAQIFMVDTSNVNFFSAAKIEDIAATNIKSSILINSASGDIVVKINNQLFKFRKELMQEHFNEEYMETSKYQYTTFTGKINEKVDYHTDGSTSVTVTGTMDMHGVKKQITIPGTITVKNGIVFLKAMFNAKLADYNVKIPSVLGSNIAESVAITLTATMKPFNSKQ